MNNLLVKASNLGYAVKFGLKKHSPEILIVAGVTGFVASTVLACKATTKLSKITEEAKKTINDIHEAAENEELKDKCTEEDVKKDLTITYIQTGVKIVKLYAPAVILGGLSIASVFASNNILRKRNAQLAAAYATVSAGFAEYRKHVVERFGEDVDRELKYNIKPEKIEETVVDENGKEKKIKKTVGVTDISDFSDYAVYFEDSCYCEHHNDYDDMFLRSQMRYANDLLIARGFLTLNEVYDGLGINVSEMKRKAGMVVGWKKEKNNKQGDNQVIFDIVHTYRIREDGEKEPCTIIDFNVDGNIYSRMGKEN